jgi:hypothetical protein
MIEVPDTKLIFEDFVLQVIESLWKADKTDVDNGVSRSLHRKGAMVRRIKPKEVKILKNVKFVWNANLTYLFDDF